MPALRLFPFLPMDAAVARAVRRSPPGADFPAAVARTIRRFPPGAAVPTAATLAVALGLYACTGPLPDYPPSFAPVQPELLGAPGALTNAWADMDGDGDPDLFVGFNGTPNRMYRNEGGVLVDVAPEVGLADARPTRTSAWGDYDGDGDPDLFLGFAPGEESVTRLYRNDGRFFTDVTAAAGLAMAAGSTRQATWVDFDADGDLDLFLALRDRPNALFQNGGGVFREVADSLGLADPRRSVGALWFDDQEDGDLDLLVANMDGDANGLFRNDQGRFTDVAGEAGLADGGRGLGDDARGTVRPCAGDFDGDGSFELAFANYGPIGLFRKQGDGRWRNVAPEMGLAIDGRYDACLFGDADNDGRPDLFVNGTVTGGTQYRDYLFRNVPEGFVDLTPPELLSLDADHGAQWVDFDQDGALDLSLAGATETGMHEVLRNLMPPERAERSLQVRVVDAQGHDTRAGAEVRVYAAGTRTLLGMGLVDSGSGYNTQSVLPVHVGLPAGGAVDVEVIFPGRGTRQATVVAGVDPRAHVGKAVVVRVGGSLTSPATSPPFGGV